MSLAALAVLAVVTLLARRTVASPVLGRLRALFPAWRFFDRAAASPQLLVRFGAPGLGAWTAIEGSPRPPLTGWAFAPAGNLALAYQATVEQLVAELGELDLEEREEPEEREDRGEREEREGDGRAAKPALGVETDPQVVGLVSYELVTRVARAHVPAGARFQWKVVVPGEPVATDYLVSPVIE